MSLSQMHIAITSPTRARWDVSALNEEIFHFDSMKQWFFPWIRGKHNTSCMHEEDFSKKRSCAFVPGISRNCCLQSSHRVEWRWKIDCGFHCLDFRISFVCLVEKLRKFKVGVKKINFCYSFCRMLPENLPRQHTIAKIIYEWIICPQIFRMKNI